MSEAWSDSEIRVALESYFGMLQLEVAGADYAKAELRRRVEPLLPGRSPKSIEFKWCNISAILEESDLPRVDGFAPLGHYQERLKELTGVWLLEHPYLRRTLEGP